MGLDLEPPSFRSAEGEPPSSTPRHCSHQNHPKSIHYQLMLLEEDLMRGCPGSLLATTTTPLRSMVCSYSND